MLCRDRRAGRIETGAHAAQDLPSRVGIDGQGEEQMIDVGVAHSEA